MSALDHSGFVCPAAATPAACERPAFHWRKTAFAAFVTAYFFYFSWDGLAARFAPDDLMNLYQYWHAGPARVLVSQFTIWEDFYRPLGGLFYLPLFYGYGFDPAPYHAVLLLILLGGVYLSCRLAILLGCGSWAAGLAALVVAYHAGLSNLYYNTAFVYDALCFFFYLAALVYYLSVRSRGEPLRSRHIAAFLGLFLCALNSKEMAVTLPPMLLVYEWLYQRPPRRYWLRAARPALIASAVTAVYVYGKVFAKGALASQSGYHPVFSRERWLDFQCRSFGDLFFRWDYFDWRSVMLVLGLATYIAWRRDRPALRFCWFHILLTPLPIEFIPGRGGACLIIPMVGWAMLVSMVFLDLARPAARFLAGEPVIWRLGERRLAALVVAVGLWHWAGKNRWLQQSFVRPAIAETGALTWNVIRQMETLHPRVRNGSFVVFLDDPFKDWDMAFIAELWFGNRSNTVRLNRKTPLSPDEIARADALFTFENGRLIRVK